MSFGKFFESLTGYRISEVFVLVGRSGLIDLVQSKKEGIETSELLKLLGWENSFGERFLETLASFDLIEKKGDRLYTTQFSRSYFLKGSAENQCSSFNFEELLMDSWKTLEKALKNGKREFSTENKDNDSYQKSLKNYISAMDDAAKIRAKELWSNFIPEKAGIILDAGAGSGAFLCEFLERNQSWDGIFCDLEDVINLAKENSRINALTKRVNFHNCNLLDEPFKNLNKKPDIILLSNVVHCYSEKELELVFENLQKIAKADTKIIIHDFFKDLSFHGALYDIHMMLNTYSGRTYTTSEMDLILEKTEYFSYYIKKLPSHSAFMVFKKGMPS